MWDFLKLKNDTVGVVPSLTLQLATDLSHAQNKHQQMPLVVPVMDPELRHTHGCAITGLSGSVVEAENPDFNENPR